MRSAIFIAVLLRMIVPDLARSLNLTVIGDFNPYPPVTMNKADLDELSRPPN